MELDEETLCRRLKLLFFLPPDWNERRRATFEKVTGYRVTESVAEAEAEAWRTSAPGLTEVEDEGAILKGAANGWADLGPLPNRLYAALQVRGLKRLDLARIFGVGSPAVTGWLYGLKLGQDPAKAKPIPEDLGILMVRWLETGQEPTREELAALPSRSRTPRRRRKTGAE